jgi:membrane protein
MLARLKVPLSWGDLAKRTLKEAYVDDVPSLAAQQAYYFFFALFPALLALISFASFFPIANLVDEIVRLLRNVAPGDVVDIVRDQMRKISESDSGGILTFAFLFTLWSSSNALLSMVTTLNAAYGVRDSRPWWKTRLIAIVLTVGLALFILVSMTLIIAGPPLATRLAEHIGLGDAFTWLWYFVQWPLVFILVATGIALVYYYAPDVEQDWVWITPGSVMATLLWIGASVGLREYLARFANYNETYGAIGAVMVLMLWFYVSGLVILLGAELNAEIEHASPYGKDVGEKVPGEKKKVGAAAERAYEERREKGELDAPPFPDDVNCDVDGVSDGSSWRPARESGSEPRPSRPASASPRGPASTHRDEAYRPSPNTQAPPASVAGGTDPRTSTEAPPRSLATDRKAR